MDTDLEAINARLERDNSKLRLENASLQEGLANTDRYAQPWKDRSDQLTEDLKRQEDKIYSLRKESAHLKGNLKEAKNYIDKLEEQINALHNGSRRVNMDTDVEQRQEVDKLKKLLQEKDRRIAWMESALDAIAQSNAK